jgi:hypothetical protein
MKKFKSLSRTVPSKIPLNESTWSAYRARAINEALDDAPLDVKTLGVEQIAKKHGKSVEYIENQLKRGIEVEKEHTSHPDKAREIALDHLGEIPDYYSKLKTHVEPDAKKLDEASSSGKHMQDHPSYGNKGIISPAWPKGTKVHIPHNGKMVHGKIVRYDKGEKHGSPFYVVDHGAPESKKVPLHQIRLAESMEPDPGHELNFSDHTEHGFHGYSAAKAQRDAYAKHLQSLGHKVRKHSTSNQLLHGRYGNVYKVSYNPKHINESEIAFDESGHEGYKAKLEEGHDPYTDSTGELFHQLRHKKLKKQPDVHQRLGVLLQWHKTGTIKTYELHRHLQDLYGKDDLHEEYAPGRGHEGMSLQQAVAHAKEHGHRVAYGTSSRKWHSIGPADRDFASPFSYDPHDTKAIKNAAKFWDPKTLGESWRPALGHTFHSKTNDELRKLVELHTSKANAIKIHDPNSYEASRHMMYADIAKKIHDWRQTRKERLEESEIAFDESGHEGYKVGDLVVPKIGPHKGQVHTVIHVHPTGHLNIKPNVHASRNKYHLGAAKADPKDVEPHRDKKIHESSGITEAKVPMPLKGHPYHHKTDAELRYIAKDAREAEEAMAGHDQKAMHKYADQKCDASTVLGYRQRGGTRIPHPLSESYQVGDHVIPKMGPHKGQTHKVIHVYTSGHVNITPTKPGKNRYALGAAKAHPDDIERSPMKEAKENSYFSKRRHEKEAELRTPKPQRKVKTNSYFLDRAKRKKQGLDETRSIGGVNRTTIQEVYQAAKDKLKDADFKDDKALRSRGDQDPQQAPVDATKPEKTSNAPPAPKNSRKIQVKGPGSEDAFQKDPIVTPLTTMPNQSPGMKS